MAAIESEGTSTRVELVERARLGDSDAINELMAQCRPRVYAACRSVLTDRELASDATQETLLRAFRSLGKLEDPARFIPWICRISIAVAGDVVRKKVRRGRILREKGKPVAPGEGDLRDPHALAARTDDLALVERALASMDEDVRTAIRLKYHAGLTHDETAQVMGLSLAKVKGIVYRGLVQLRSSFEGEDREV